MEKIRIIYCVAAQGVTQGSGKRESLPAFAALLRH
jgi:hypothetical protein